MIRVLLELDRNKISHPRLSACRLEQHRPRQSSIRSEIYRWPHSNFGRMGQCGPHLGSTQSKKSTTLLRTQHLRIVPRLWKRNDLRWLLFRPKTTAILGCEIFKESGRNRLDFRQHRRCLVHLYSFHKQKIPNNVGSRLHWSPQLGPNPEWKQRKPS